MSHYVHVEGVDVSFSLCFLRIAESSVLNVKPRDVFFPVKAQIGPVAAKGKRSEEENEKNGVRFPFFREKPQGVCGKVEQLVCGFLLGDEEIKELENSGCRDERVNRFRYLPVAFLKCNVPDEIESSLVQGYFDCQAVKEIETSSKALLASFRVFGKRPQFPEFP